MWFHLFFHCCHYAHYLYLVTVHALHTHPLIP